MNNPVGFTLITGVGKGFGRDLFVHRAKKIGKVVGFTRSLNDIAALKEELKESGVDYHLYEVDVTDYGRVNEIIRGLKSKNIFIESVINNAGMRFRKPFLDISVDDLQLVLNNNVVSIHNICRACIPDMLENGKGRVINISSILGDVALAELAAYSISKGALNALTKSLAVEFADQNITVNGIAPGFCKTSYYGKFIENKVLHENVTSKIPMKRWGESSELIGICDFLLSDSAGYITGVTIPVDGGWLAC